MLGLRRTCRSRHSNLDWMMSEMSLIRCIGCDMWVRDNVVRCGLCGVTVRRSIRQAEKEAKTEEEQDDATSTDG